MSIIGLPVRKKDNTISVKDAMVLENNEQIQLQNNRVRRCIDDTYGPKSPTKKRRTLPGKRVWKDKTKQYAVLRGAMYTREFNAKNAATRVLSRLYKERAAKRTRHSLVD